MMPVITSVLLLGYTDGYMSKKAAEDPPAIQSWLRKAEGFIPKARVVTNAEGSEEPYKTVGTGHYLSPANKAKLQELWGADRFSRIQSGAEIRPEEDRAAIRHHLETVVPEQLDAWNKNWRKLNPMLQNWLKTHAYSLGGNLRKFRQGHNAVNALVYNPTEANAERLRKAFRDSTFARQTGTRLDKVRPLFESGKRIVTQTEKKRK